MIHSELNFLYCLSLFVDQVFPVFKSMTSKEDADVVIKQLDVCLREIQFFEPVDNNISQYQKYYKVKTRITAEKSLETRNN